MTTRREVDPGCVSIVLLLGIMFAIVGLSITLSVGINRIAGSLDDVAPGTACTCPDSIEAEDAR